MMHSTSINFLIAMNPLMC